MLLVDDEQDILWSLHTFFEQSVKGLKVRAASSGAEALEILKREKIHLIMTDYRMPEMDGVQFIQEARKIHPDIPSIMITAYPDPALAARAVKDAGVGLFVAKPFDLDYLITLVRSMFENPNPLQSARPVSEVE